MEQGKILKRSMEQEKNPGARGKIKREQGAQKNEKRATHTLKVEYMSSSNNRGRAIVWQSMRPM